MKGILKMTIKELMEFLSEENVPDDAEVYIQADHGQQMESPYFGVVTRDDPISSDDPEEMIWEYDEWEKDNFEDDVAQYNRNGDVRAVLLTSF